MKFYGIDLHHDNFTVVCTDEKNQESRWKEYLGEKGLRKFLAKLSGDDYVAVEACTNAFWFYDRVIERVKECYVIDPWKFSENVKSNKKTDKVDAKKISKKLKYRVMAGGDEEDLPTVYVPLMIVRELRSLFSTYKMLVKQKTMMKNRINSLVIQQGKYLGNKIDIERQEVKEMILRMRLPETTVFQVELLYEQIESLEGRRKALKEKILEEGSYFQDEIEILMSMKGVSAFIAIAIMADVADISRFATSKKLTSYLRSAPKVDSSNRSEKIGRVNRHSRKLSMEMLLQGLVHVIKSSNYLENFYIYKRGGSKKAGKARVAVARKTFTYMYQMLKKKEYFRWRDPKNHERKIVEYRSFLKRRGKQAEMKKSA